MAGGLVVLLIWSVVAAAQAGVPAAAPSSKPSHGGQPAASASASPSTEPSRPDSGSCGAADVTVDSAEALQQALDDAAPGRTIALADGVYAGQFVATVSGTKDAPITLCGGTGAVLDGGGTGKGYVLHLDGAQYWRLTGFTVQNGQKGVMADGTVGSEIRGLTVTMIGDEGIHLRNFSTDNVVADNTVSQTGLRKPKFGEGIYIGTAESNWCDISGCKPDLSDRNVIENNTISATTAESVDIKEGTSNGVLRGNSFNGAGIDTSGADSWVDVKGNGWLIEGNTGVDSPQDGFQTHEILDGWGTGNTFRGNTAAVNGPGFGFSLTPVRDNVVTCDNTATGAGEGLANVSCR
ncbi:MAG: hypothetical protein DI534_01855 [Leifsonia xyli]|nr:MAG: hypothetical protein DI534_01855 [Leifsonia xyli]